MPHTGRERGFTLIELLIVVAVIGIIAAIAIPGLLRSRIAANEASAVGSLRTIISAQEDFASQSRGFADDLATLARVCPDQTVPFLSSELTTNGATKSGYTFRIAAGLASVAGAGNDCFGNPTRSSYYATATPLGVGSSGNRGFATNIAATIWQDTSGAVPGEPFRLMGSVSPLGR